MFPAKIGSSSGYSRRAPSNSQATPIATPSKKPAVPSSGYKGRARATSRVPPSSNRVPPASNQAPFSSNNQDSSHWHGSIEKPTESSSSLPTTSSKESPYVIECSGDTCRLVYKGPQGQPENSAGK